MGQDLRLSAGPFEISQANECFACEFDLALANRICSTQLIIQSKSESSRVSCETGIDLYGLVVRGEGWGTSGRALSLMEKEPWPAGERGLACLVH
jgi:hypothetical protein